MIHKGLNIKEECCGAHFIDVHVPPGNHGQSQMLPKDIKKINDIAKLCILVEQVIRRSKTLSTKEWPISLVNNIDNIMVICAALTNLQSPIY